MWFKKKVVTPPLQEKKPECNHKYKDFDWYYDATYYMDTERYVVKVYEPYVCILCGYRKDVLLEEKSGYGREKLRKVEDRIDQYPKVKDRAYVEDEIADMQLLDPYYLEAYYKLYPERKPLNLHDD